ncbi:MAG: DUF6603 domain-containing protein, partial [Pseudonocardiaceae bacterium]
MSGEVALLPDRATTCLATAPTGDPFTIAGYRIPFRVSLVVAAQQPSDGSLPKTVASVMQFDATIEKDVDTGNAPHVIALPVLLRTMPGVAGVLTLGSELPKAAPISLGEVAALVAGHSLDDQVTTAGGFPALTDIVLEGVSVTFAPGLRDPLVSVGATIGLANPDPTGWGVFDDLIVFKNMAVTFTYVPQVGGVQTEVQAEAVIAGGTLDASIALPDLVFDLELIEGTSIDIKQIVNHIAGGSVAMPQINCTALAVNGDVPGNTYRFQATVSDSWIFDIGGKAFALTEVGLGLTYDTALSGEISGKFTVAELELFVSAGYNAATGGWSFAGGTLSAISLNLDQLAAGLATDLGLSFPKTTAPAGLTLENLNVFYDTGTGDLEFTGLAAFQVAGVACQLGISVARRQGATAFTGMLFIGEEAFEVAFQTGTDTVLSGSWSAADGESALDIVDIIRGLSFNPPGIPTDLNLSLFAAQISYDVRTSTLVLSATTSTKRKATLVTTSVGGTREFYFGLSVGDFGSLGDLPVVGDALSRVLQIRDLKVILSSQPLTPQAAAAVVALVPPGYPGPPLTGTGDQIALSLTADIGGTELPLSLGLRSPSSTSQNTVVPTPPVASPVKSASPATGDGVTTPSGSGTATSAPTAAGGVLWYKVQRSFGPFTLDRVGLAYQHPPGQGAQFAVLLDASVSVGPLALSLDGLTIGLSLADPAALPSFDLAGIGVGYAAGPVEISGAFLKGQLEYAGRTYPAYSGSVQIRTEQLSLAAIGSYVQLASPSLFAYAVLNDPIGGPPFFFVRGLAAGFGYNRRLVLPDVANIASFPLVTDAVSGPPAGSTLGSDLQRLQNSLVPAIGDYFLAVGVHFTSFGMIDTFVLLAAGFGHRFELDVLGLSTLTLPAPTGTGDPDPIAEVQLALRATFVPEDGYLTITAQLTPNSFVLSRACHLRGGFAFSTWFSGEHEGDFVITAGGYHPRFPVPSHYPTVPRLGFDWQVCPELTLSGTGYYALTPGALMAGGSVAATWRDDSLLAWFSATMDFLIGWQPYHYEAGIQVAIGASYTFSGFGNSTISVHVGADVQLWGPDFGGTATLDLDIISVTISFGSSRTAAPKPLPWAQLRSTLLPTAVTTIALRSAGTQTAPSPPGTAGSASTESTDLGVVDPAGLVLATDCLVPSTAAVRGAPGHEVA